MNNHETIEIKTFRDWCVGGSAAGSISSVLTVLPGRYTARVGKILSSVYYEMFLMIDGEFLEDRLLLRESEFKRIDPLTLLAEVSE